MESSEYQGKEDLARGGDRVTACTSSLETLAPFRSEPDGYDLVIIDFTISNLTGTAVACELLKRRTVVPIVLTTGFGRPMSEE